METREAPRLPISATALVKVDPSSEQHFNIAKNNITVQITDISVNGMALASEYFIPKGVIIALEFKISDKLINTKGEIRSAILGDKGKTRLGVKFVDIKKEQRQIIDNFIKENERRIQPRLGVERSGEKDDSSV